MPATSIFDLLDPETSIEEACKTVLQGTLTGISPALPTIGISISRDSDTNETPRFDLQFASGEAILQYGAIGQANPKQVTVASNGTLTVSVVTTRPNDNARMDPLHGLMRAIARYTFSPQAKVFTTSNLPYFEILEILPAGMRPQMQENKEQDISVLQFAVKFAVRNDAWPATA